MSNGYTTADFMLASEWVKAHGGQVLPHFSAYQWFKRQHYTELVESGELITGRGRAGDAVGPGFGRLVIEIMQREQRKQRTARQSVGAA